MSEGLMIVPAQATDEMVNAGAEAMRRNNVSNTGATFPAEAFIKDARLCWPAMAQAFDPITWEVAKAQITRELIEQAEAEAQAARSTIDEINAIPDDGNWMAREHDLQDASNRLLRALTVASWLKSQIEGE